MAEKQEKSARPRHYTPVEREIFLELLTKVKDVIENKKSDGVFLKKKEEAWKNVERNYNSSHLITQERTVAQLKKWWSNLKQHQREAKTKEKQERLKTGGGPSEAVPDIDPQIEIIAPHLMVNAPTLFSSNMSQDEYDAAVCTLDIANMEVVTVSDNGSAVPISSERSSSSESLPSQTEGNESLPEKSSAVIPVRKRKRSLVSTSSNSSSGDESIARSERIKRISDREEEVHQAHFSIELQMLQDKKAHARKLQEILEMEATEKAREAKGKADEAEERAREAKVRADLAELQLKQAKEEDEMF